MVKRLDSTNASAIEDDIILTGKRIAISCFPKSGSTFITRSLSEYTGFPKEIIATSAEVQEISEQRLRGVYSKTPSFISQTHIHPTKHNLKIIKKYKMDSVFLYRNVMDCIVSLRDMYVERIQNDKGVWKGSFVSQWGYYDQRFLGLDLEEQLDYMIEGSLSWYLQCYATWNKKIQNDKFACIIIKYEDFFADTGKNFDGLLQKLGLYDKQKSKSFQLPEKRAGRQGVRFNVGRAGRGRELLTKAQQDRIFDTALRFEKGTGCDFSELIGK